MQTTDKYSSINGEVLYTGNFKPERKPLNVTDDSLVFCFFNNKILFVNDCIPKYYQLKPNEFKIKYSGFVGYINKEACFAIELVENNNIKNSFQFIELRQAYTMLNEDELKAAIFSSQIINWNRKTQFCGACGTKCNESSGIDWVKKCDNCGEQFYPKISPAIIVAIEKNGKLLMAQHQRLPQFYAIIAGFVNPGESLEECVHREVMEETGIEIENLEYFSSQPWPFPDSLMVGYKAKYKAGKLTPDQTEIIDLKWFAPNEIPEWGNRSSIARALIDNFIRTHSS